MVCETPFGSGVQVAIVTGVSPKILWKSTPKIGYNIEAFDLCGCKQYPALQRACLHYPASSSAYFNTKGTQYHHGKRNSKVV